jgi:hypothetical protein
LEVPPWSCAPGPEEEENAVYRTGTPSAKEGFLTSTKKGTFGKYGSLRRRYVVLVPSLGAVLYFRKETDLVPFGVFGVPPADRIYPKRGVIQIGSNVHIYTIRINLPDRPYTLICKDPAERDDWVLKLKTVGERWSHSKVSGMQVR